MVVPKNGWIIRIYKGQSHKMDDDWGSPHLWKQRWISVVIHRCEIHGQHLPRASEKDLTADWGFGWCDRLVINIYIYITYVYKYKSKYK